MDTIAKRVFITGGTGSVGQALVHSFARKGYKIIFQYKSNDVVAKDLCKTENVSSWKTDFSANIELPNIEIDVVINGTGINLTRTLTHEVSLDEWQETLTVNLTAPFMIIKNYLPNMIKNHWGRIINIGSIYSVTATTINSSYNTSKHGLSGLTKSVAKEYAQSGITCNEILPSAIESEIMRGIASRKEKEGKTTAEGYLQAVRDFNPMKRMADPTDIANLAVFLASNEATFINGASIVVDGGQIC